MKHVMSLNLGWVRPALFCLAITSVFVSSVGVARPLTPREIYEQRAKGVVLVFGTNGGSRGNAGTGSIISSDGQIITNAHVVSSKRGVKYRKIRVFLKPDTLTGSTQKDLRQSYAAVVVDMNRDLDVALLKMENPPPDLTVIDFVDPKHVAIGEPVVAIGHPETGGLWTLTTGTVSSVVADFQGTSGKDVFQTDASVNRGNSGGPLLNAFGQMVGINTSISRRADDGLAITDVNFSLKSSVAVEWMSRRRVLNVAYAPPPVRPDRPMMASVPPPAATVNTQTGISVVEPPKGEEVAEDPSFSRLASHTYLASDERVVDADDMAPKHLTKARPYQMDRLIQERIRVMGELNDMMDDMRGRIEKRSRSRVNSQGLW